ncbi:uncharacterized protein TRIVIDRAFT_68459 [Trichoderma virens Gv29-8]|uniref:Uncharacterized protein n=1 Tax=Hypocrea virens (strain Gv29-8 / FGSC 10586) TaxID=413071 RepID=G9N4B3_HYPVG|nr:uncharacterized protein TRIVIDRAFT_68459 [Trichoderma virens Gv29-8]EHK18439.1 hypothetical protein TRIVIDRAFT_68459 [Trichoderma virens Gv29-8]
MKSSIEPTTQDTQPKLQAGRNAQLPPYWSFSAIEYREILLPIKEMKGNALWLQTLTRARGQLSSPAADVSRQPYAVILGIKLKMCTPMLLFVLAYLLPPGPPSGFAMLHAVRLECMLAPDTDRTCTCASSLCLLRLTELCDIHAHHIILAGVGSGAKLALSVLVHGDGMLNTLWLWNEPGFSYHQ